MSGSLYGRRRKPFRSFGNFTNLKQAGYSQLLIVELVSFFFWDLCGIFVWDFLNFLKFLGIFGGLGDV